MVLIFATTAYDKIFIKSEPSVTNPIINLNEKYSTDINYNSEAVKEAAKIDTIKKELPRPPYKYGDKGIAIEELQKLLNNFGYKIVIDGIFGASTEDAIINFQHRLGLDVDGIVGEQTFLKLNTPPMSSTMYNPNELIAKQSNATFSSNELAVNSKGLYSNTNYYMVIDIKSQRVNVFNGYKDHWKLIRSMPCATGKPETPTVKGFFSVGDKGDMFRAGDNTICKYYTRFYGNYLFHTVLLDNQGNIQDPTLGTPASHGCVRLAIEDAKYIYYNIPFGTSVWSY